MTELTPGYYRHFKGNYYYLVEVATHSESLEPMVVYRALYGERKLWVRPASMWTEVVDKQVEGWEYHGPRFAAVDEKEVPEEIKRFAVPPLPTKSEPPKRGRYRGKCSYRNTNKVIDMKKIDYRTLYHQIEACILQKADSDASDFEYTPYLWVHMIDEELDVAICETNEQAVDMYSFDNLYETFFDIDTGIEHVVNAAEVHKIVRKWCLAPTAQQSRNYTIPEVFTEELLMEFCERFRDVIADGNIKGAPEINVRYAVCDTMFHVAKFGDYFFFEDKMYVFDKNPIWAPFHDEFAVKACFDKDCKSRGYAHVVAFCGIQTPYRDDKGDAIFTGDICYSTSCGNEYRVLTANKYEGYGFAGDNCMYLMDMIHEPVHRVGTIFYELSLEEPMVNTWIKGGEICNMWGQAPDIDEKLMKAKLTPSFMQEPIEYFVISNITEEYDWRIIFDAKKAIPKKKKSK